MHYNICNIKKGDTMSNVECRRGFLKAAAGLAGAAVVAPVLMAGERKGSGSGAYLAYEHKNVGSFSNLKKDGEIDFNYPDAESPCKAVIVNGQVKAYSLLCTHKGCPTVYDAETKIFECPCHFSKFDAEKDGEMIIGQATGSLPRVLVEVKNGDIIAYGIDGLVFGRESNIL
jgi:arsenite oxidase small subunit